jgi:Transposase domain (DUF772)
LREPFGRGDLVRQLGANCVEKFRLIEAPGADSLVLGAGDSVDDGGTAGDTEALLYCFSLERHVPDGHLLRKIDRFVDLTGLRAHLGPYHSDVGRPSIDPELMIRMLIVGYCFGIRSERRLCEKVHLNRSNFPVPVQYLDIFYVLLKQPMIAVSCAVRARFEAGQGVGAGAGYVGSRAAVDRTIISNIAAGAGPPFFSVPKPFAECAGRSRKSSSRIRSAVAATRRTPERLPR